MPVEIRELVIRTIVTAAADDDDSDTAAGGMASGGSASSETDAIVQECVRQVLRIIRKERER
jgi:hypothetical protein